MNPTGFTAGRAGPPTLVAPPATAVFFGAGFGVGAGVGLGLAVGRGGVGTGAGAVTTTVAAEVLFAPTFWSAWLAPIEAVLVNEPAVAAVTLITILAEAPTSSVPIAHVIVVEPLQLPCVVVTETAV